MAEMTPEREAEIGKLLGFHRIYGHEQSRRSCQWCEVATELLTALRAEREWADAAEREREAYKTTAAFTKRAWDEFADELRRITGYTGPDDGDVLLTHVKTLTREVERLIAALNWALGTGNLGTGNEFAPRGPYDAPYWWRPELQRRAGLVWDGEQFVISAPDKP